MSPQIASSVDCVTLSLQWLMPSRNISLNHVWMHLEQQQKGVAYACIARPIFQCLELSLYCLVAPKPIMHLQGILVFGEKYRTNSPVPNSPNSPHSPFPSMEKRRLRALRIRQRSPRIATMPLQRVSFTEKDLPEMHFVPVRALNASHWTGVDLGEV